jgi:general stress protein 26
MENIMHQEEDVKKFKELIEYVDVCMFTTLDDNYKLHSRPMSTAHVDEEGNAWFFTNEFSEKISEISRDNVVNLIYSDPAKNIYVNVKGTCTVIIDRKKMEELWTPVLKAWFPEGIDDPKLCLVKVITEDAYYWNNKASKMTTYFNMLTAIEKGEKYEEGESGKLQLS